MMELSRYDTDTILLDDNKSLSRRFITPHFIAEIIKIRIEYNHKHAEDMTLKITSTDGETLVNTQGSQNELFYPRNMDVANQKMVGANIASEGQDLGHAERYVIHGPLIIDIKGSKLDDHVKNISIVYDGEILEDDMMFMKDGMVTTSTPGVHNATHDRRRRHLKQYVGILTNQIADSPQEAETLKKADPEGLREFIEESLYTHRFDGTGKTLSDLIKDFMLRSAVKGYSKDKVMKYLARKGIAKKQANNIFRTETQSLRNKTREWSYKQIDPEGELKYKWIGPDDGRTTKTCDRITRRTGDGVTLDKLKSIIQEETDAAIARGELPKGYDPREYTPHFMCRHTFIRSF